ncbi:uncharacterized protein LAJ45_06722 [Morchella importuna]|uniref:Exosome complex protein n=1 Tax=Morchella conica CCBAS932 TaxID=1392247 RepID=A0A3N4KG25_9PEZI|nr:uncharacterized protein LAJ45_06722 [Morchella importuna]KAH8149183.1 hypothetical protein LAJ45_06722 [Morchella importuna]RPB09483.1 hypothetical protein P167DRAFT_594115 [Morchella conica CCBAS932]
MPPSPTSPLTHLSLLDEQLDDLTTTLAPLLTTPGLPSLTATLPIADQARLSVLTAYTLESLLFTYLRLNGVDAKSHPVMEELARVRQYVAKINAAQEAPKRRAAVDKEAVGRFVKAGLAGNTAEGEGVGEKEERERARAKFEEVSRRMERREVEEEEAKEREKGEREKENEEQVTRILESFRSHGVKRGSDEEASGSVSGAGAGGGAEKRKRRRGRKGK